MLSSVSYSELNVVIENGIEMGRNIRLAVGGLRQKGLHMK
jgi:hypothetical protein